MTAAGVAGFASLRAAVDELVPDGSVVALEGFSHLVPYAAGHELIRLGRTGLTLVRMVPDVLADQLVGAGCVASLVFGWAGNPGLGLLHRVRDAVENGWPRPLDLTEHTHAELANRYVAGASRTPYAVLRGEPAPTSAVLSPHVAVVESPFTGERATAVRAINPDVAVVHAQYADRHGNVGLHGVTGVQKEAVLAAGRSLVTVEEIVPDLPVRPNMTVLPHWAVTAIAEAPGGAAPSYALGHYPRDHDAHTRWKQISRDRDRFTRWLADEIGAPSDPTGGCS